MERYVITIQREFGSMGRPIARRLSELLGIEYYDRDIVEETSKKMKLPVSVISGQEEKGSGFFRMMFPLGNENSSNQEEIFQVQEKIIRELADKESCIIVGRCSDYILRNEKNAVHIYIYAPYEARLRNCVDILGMTENEAKKMINSVDEARRKFHKRYTKSLPGELTYKDILINSNLLGIDGTAQQLANIVRARFNISD